MVKKIVWLSVLLLAAAGAGAQRRVMLDKVVAVVGGSSITYTQVKNYADQLVAQRRAAGYTSDRDPMNEALEQLMTQKLLFNQAQIDSVDISHLTGQIHGQVEDAVQGMIAEAGSIPAVEARMHAPIFDVRENMRRELEERAYAQEMQQTVIGKVTVTPGEVDRFYKEASRDSLPEIGDQYVYAQITRYPKSMAEAKRRTRERMLELRARIINGEKFDLLARIYSMDGSALHGGEMEPMTLNSWVQPFADAVEKLKPGQISEVVETQFGYHLIELLDKKGDLYHVRHILLRPNYTIEELAAPSRELDSIAQLIRTDSITFEKAALEFSDDVYSKMNGGIVTNNEWLERVPGGNVAYTATKFLAEDFGNIGPSAIADYRMLSRMKPGEISTAYQTQDLDGNQLSKIVKLVEVIPAHTASLADDYLRLEQIALNEKQMKYFDEWLSKKIDAMYVLIDPEFRDGEFQNKHWVK